MPLDDLPLTPLQGYPGKDSAGRSDVPIDAFIEEMLAYRSAICHEYAIRTDHNQCIGCLLVLDFMKNNHANLKYGTKEQWEMESAFCTLHERDIIKEFIRQKEAEGVQIPSVSGR